MLFERMPISNTALYNCYFQSSNLMSAEYKSNSAFTVCTTVYLCLRIQDINGGHFSLAVFARVALLQSSDCF